MPHGYVHVRRSESGKGMALLPCCKCTINMIIAADSVAAKHLRIVSSNENVFAQDL